MKNPDTLHINTINADWCDKDIVMLHACFQLLTDCVEKEELFNGNTDWDHDEKSIAARVEIEELYNWWLERKLKGERTSDLKGEPYEEDSKMLIRLIKIRKYLWT